MRRQTIILISIVLILFFVVINYNSIDSFLIKSFDNSEKAFIERVIDGDTIKTNESSIRLLGINSPERGEQYSEEAKEFLESLVLEKEVELKYGKDKTDLYNRTLAYVYLNNENVNLKLVEEGFANFYFPSGKDIYYNDFKEAWEDCIDKNINLCEKSVNECVDCIILKEFNHKEQFVVFYNQCDFDCNLEEWSIKDEGRKKFVFGNFVLNSGEKIEITEKDFNETYVWTSSGDTLFLRDSEGKLVSWESY